MEPEEAFFEISKLAGNFIRHVTITGGEPLLPENVSWMKVLGNMLLGAGYAIDVLSRLIKSPYKIKEKTM
ncbi:hypothetical protein [Fibrobacter sp.]|uniref:hypothetical protein n=1 Tax=Fibrobacter sp. TaxID=35828 RepID=UPI0025C60A38|nr:hypothetical protein [Fibrobacter sp.]MBR4007074.1 hypothetical protein [Fibrobacter sp.]